MTEKNTHEKLKEETELKELSEEYERIAEIEGMYLDEIASWRRLERAVIPCILVGSFIAMMLSILTLPPHTTLDLNAFQEYPFQVTSLYVFMVVVLASMVANPLLKRKMSKIENELGLHREERLYLNAYETYLNIDSFLRESNMKRKLHFKRMALRTARELTDNVDGWKYGNIRLVASLVGDQIDLLKDNIRRLVLSNVANGDETAFQNISKILVEFCKYIRSPSVKKLGALSDMIKELPYKEYKYLTRKEKLGEYLYTRPRFFRLLFAVSITASVMMVLWCLNQNIGIIIAVAVPCFWGAFSGFDKLFRVKEK